MSCEHDMANGTCSQCDPYVVQNLRTKLEAVDAERLRYSAEIAKFRSELEASERALLLSQQEFKKMQSLWWQAHRTLSDLCMKLAKELSEHLPQQD